MEPNHPTTGQDVAFDVVHGEALAYLAGLPDASVDAVVTDPPYSSGGMTRGDRATGSTVKYIRGEASAADLGDFVGDNRDQRGFAMWCTLWLSEALRVTRPGGVCLLFSDWRQLPTVTDVVQAGGWVWRGVVPWAKDFGGLGCRPERGRFAAQCEYVVWGSCGPVDADEALPCFPGFFEGNPPRGKRRLHPTEKPVNVVRELVRITPVGGLVLDPFCGSGTTGVACVLEGRRFVGVESVARYAVLARRRIALAAGCVPPVVVGERTVLELPSG